MLSRTGRSATVLIVAQAVLTLMFPAPASSATFLGCGDPGPHSCCHDESESCNGPGETGMFCCFYSAPNADPRFCGCQYAE